MAGRGVDVSFNRGGRVVRRFFLLMRCAFGESRVRLKDGVRPVLAFAIASVITRPGSLNLTRLLALRGVMLVLLGSHSSGLSALFAAPFGLSGCSTLTTATWVRVARLFVRGLLSAGGGLLG